MSKTIGIAATSKAGSGSRTATVCRAAPTGMRIPASRPTARSDGPPVSSTRSVWIGPASVSTATDPAGAPGDPLGPQAGERCSLTDLDAGGLHRERVRAHVARRVDRAVGRQVAPAAMAGRRQRHGGGRRLVRVEPGNVEAVRALHRDPFATRSLVVLGDGKDQVAELAEARVGPVGGPLAVVEGDRPATERDRRRGAALRPDHAGRPRRGAHPDEPAVDDHDAFDPARPGEHGRPATDRPGPDDHQVSPIRRHLLPPHRRPP